MCFVLCQQTLEAQVHMLDTSVRCTSTRTVHNVMMMRMTMTTMMTLTTMMTSVVIIRTTDTVTIVIIITTSVIGTVLSL